MSIFNMWKKKKKPADFEKLNELIGKMADTSGLKFMISPDATLIVLTPQNKELMKIQLLNNNNEWEIWDVKDINHDALEKALGIK